MGNTSFDDIFISGPIPPPMIADLIALEETMTHTGAHAIFLGQVREDLIDGKKVRAILYTAYEEMALSKFKEIIETANEKFDLHSLKIYHSLGEVKTGEICLFVFVTAAHRVNVFEAKEWVVEAIKSEVPVFGKELLEGDSYQWKVNT